MFKKYLVLIKATIDNRGLCILNGRSSLSNLTNGGNKLPKQTQPLHHDSIP